jgi:3-dehydroquinate synthase
MPNSKSVTRITVPLGERTYPILIGDDLLKETGRLAKEHGIPRSCVVITDTNVAPLYLPAVIKSLQRHGFEASSIVIPAGEVQKSLRRAEKIYTQLLRRRAGRRTAIIALGGGVVGDLAGFIAATYQRGLPFVQVPTTLLSQVDSSVGGKVGINHPLGKNMIGAFHQPLFVLADISTLQTLPEREIVCGLGEVVKYGVILDAAFFSRLQGGIQAALRHDTKTLRRFVAECCTMKSFVVSRDEREDGLRSILNFGHTIGHALEKAGGYRSLKHGEAVLWGMLAETMISRRVGLIDREQEFRIYDLIRSVPLPEVPRSSSAQLLRTMRNDKKSTDAQIRFILPRSIGTVTLPTVVEEKLISRVLRDLSWSY